jgi:hypothetical protein
MRWSGGRRGQKILDALSEIPERNSSGLIFGSPGGALHQLDICASEAKWLLRKRERRQGRPSERWYQHPVVGPVHGNDRAGVTQAQLRHVLG